MIIVDIKVPALDKVYNFSISENAEVGMLIEELTEMICQREKLNETPDEKHLSLYCITDKMLLDRQQTLSDYGIHSGAQLMLI